MKKGKEKKILDALLKKGLGYETTEEVTEFRFAEDGEELVKKKVTKKQIPPDTAALKTYITLTDNIKNIEEMSEQELIFERGRLLKELKTIITDDSSDITNKTED